MRVSVNIAIAVLCWAGISSPVSAQIDLGSIVDTVTEPVQTVTETVTDTVTDIVTETVPDVVSAPPAEPPSTPSEPPAVSVAPPVVSIAPVTPAAPVVVAPNAATLPQGAAIEAVKTARAVPLERIIQNASAHSSGDVVDAQLISVRGFLLYQIKVIEEDGDVSELYFYAKSGELVRD